MKNKSLNRTLSLMLAVMMVISLLPATVVFAVKDMPPTPVEYIFKTEAQGGDWKGGSTFVALDGASSASDYADGRDWAYLGYTGTASNSKSCFLQINTSLLAVTANGQWLALKIKAPEAGTYSLSASAYMDKNSTNNMEIYLVPMNAVLDAENNKTAADVFARSNADIYGTVSAGVCSGYTSFEDGKLGEYDLSDYLVGKTNLNAATAGNADCVLTEAKPVTVTEKTDEYVLFFAPNGTGSRNRIYPASFAFTPVKPSATYTFKTSRNGGDWETSSTLVALDGASSASDYADGRDWAYLGYTGSKSSNSTFLGINVSLQCNTAKGQWVALKTKVPEPGTYSLSATAYMDSKCTNNMEIYLVPMNAVLDDENNKTAADVFARSNTALYGAVSEGVCTGAASFTDGKLGEYDLSSYLAGRTDTYRATGGNADCVLTDAGSVTIPEGVTEYVLLFAANGTGSYNRMYPASLTLGKKGEPPASVELSCDTEMRVGGNSVQAKATVKTATGSQFLGAYSIKYTSSDESVATVDDDGKIIAKGAGSARITVYAAEEGADDVSIINAAATDYVDITVHEDFEGGTYSFVLTTDAILASSGLITSDGKVLNGNFTKITPDKLNWMTNGYAIDGMNGRHSGNSCCMTESSLVYMIRTDGGTNRAYDNNPYIAIRLKDISAGLYRLSLFNTSSSTGTAPMKVYFGKAPESYPGVDGIIDLCGEYGSLGIHDSRTAHDGTEELPAEHFEVTAEEDGDYYFVLLADPETYAMNPTATVDRPYQYIYLDNIKLETVKPLKTAELSVESDNISAPKKTQAKISLFAEDGSEFIGEYDVKYSSDNTSAATVDETSGLITAKEVDGDTRVKITAEIAPKADPQNVKTAFAYLTVTSVPEIEEIISITAGGSEHIRLATKEVQDRIPMYVTASDNSGGELTQDEVELKATAINPDIADIDEDLNIIPKAPGKAGFEVSAVYRGKETPAKTATLTVAYAKEKATYMTAEKAELARENIKKYDWAKNTAEDIIELADKIVDKLDMLYDMIPSEGIPRNCVPGNRSDPYVYMCKYCGCDIRAEYGAYGWVTDPFSRPWKLQCPDCKRLFPSNDFGSFYKLGLNEYGEFDRIRALEKHHEMIYHKNGACSYAGECGKLPAEENRTEWLEYFGYGQGYLKNDTYKELYTSGNALSGIDPFWYNADLDGDGKADEAQRMLGGAYGNVSAGMLWGVDDGFGYVPLEENGDERYPLDINGNRYTDKYGLQVYERHMYIATYVHNGVWYGLSSGESGVIKYGVSNCAAAYFYTGDKKYGRVAAILLDRIADFYPDLNYEQHTRLFGHNYQGKIVDRIWSCSTAQFFIQAYDEVFELYETDPYIVEYINSRKVNGMPLKFRYAKETGSQICTHIEDGIVRESLEGLKSGKVAGNYGMDQKVNASGAVVLDSQPETTEWLEFMMAAGWHTLPGSGSTGGGIYAQLTDDVDADGQGTEGSAYNAGWVSNMILVQEILEDYPSGIDFQEIPKYTQMLYSNIPLMSATYTPQIGDSSSTLGKDHWMTSAIAQDGWKGLRDPVFAQLLYLFNGNKADGLHYDITDENPERLEDEVQAVIDEHGEFKLSSAVMTGFGFAALRSGDDFTSSVNASGKDTRRDVWLYFGALGASHAHTCALNLGMTAFGLNFMPDLGYPAATGNDVNRTQWIDTTFSHNTVIVDDKQQKGDIEIRGKIKHFSDDGNIKLMDVSAPFAYPAETYSVDEYRRSVLQIDVDDENSYVVDFFRVLGGNSHTYNLHASSNAISEHLGLGEVVPQTDEKGNYIGSYAGPDVPYGEGAAGIPYGHTWLENIDRASEPEDKMEIDFEIKDFNKAIKDSKGLHLRMTMLNGTNVAKGADASLVIADGHPPKKAENKNIDRLKYVLLKNEGENLDSTFTTVFEPYRSVRYLSSSDELTMNPAHGTPAASDDARAVKVTHTNGRVDYIFWATNNGVTYEVTDGDTTLAFRGFMGVYTMQNGENTLRYLHDGDILCEKTEDGIVTTGEPASIEGSVKSFTKTPEEKNEIVITPAPGTSVTDEELGALRGKLLVVENGDDVRSGTFKIEGAALSGDDIAIDIGRVTPIRQYVDAYEPEKGYVYMIAEGQNARIPLSVSEDDAPEFDSVADNLSVSAGSSISVTVNAESPLEGKTVTYVGATLPRGASLNANTGVVTWKPDASQVGKNHFAIKAADDFGRNSTVHFTVTVYGSTTGSKKEETENTPVDTPPAGGGGGGAAPETSDKTDNGETDTSDENDNADTSTQPNVGNGGSDVPQFIDLGSHAWAENAINALAADGIIKGTSASTFAPANNITRADFALLLVRAFKLSSDNTENFADVMVNDYYASELAIARNTGIVSGIGDNKFAPRNSITRQDMMVIVYRALQKLNVGFGACDEPQNEDFDTVADYAKEAVSTLISAGLINGKSNLIAPLDYTTRAEVAVLIKRILDYTNQKG